MKNVITLLFAFVAMLAACAPRAIAPSPPHKLGANVYTEAQVIAFGTLTTSGNAATPATVVAVPDKESEVYEVDVIMVRQTTSNPYVAGWKIYATVGRDPASGNAAFVTGGASASANPLVAYQHTPIIGGATPTAVLSVSSTNMTLTVTGVATTTLVWQYVVKQRVLSST